MISALVPCDINALASEVGIKPLLREFMLVPQQMESVLAGSLPLRRPSFSFFSLCFSSFS